MRSWRGVGALIQRGGRAVAGMLTIATAAGHDLDVKSRVHPKYTTTYRVGNWAEYDRALVRRGDVTRRWCMNRNWPATILTQRLLTSRYRTTLARQGPSSDLGCCMRAAPRPFALLACALEGQCR